MPLTKTGKKVLAKMQSEYGPKKGKEVFYAMAHSKGKQWHHSPDSYDDTGTAAVPGRKEYHATQEGVAESSAKGTAVGGTENLRTTAVTKQGANPTTPGGTKHKWPSGVKSYSDGEV